MPTANKHAIRAVRRGRNEEYAADCQSDNCVDDVCCDTPCDGPNQVCNLPGRVGECAVAPAPAPAASRGGLLAIAATLVAVAALALLRRRAR